MAWVLTVSHETPLFTRIVIFEGLRDKGPAQLGMSYDSLKYVEGLVYADTDAHGKYVKYLGSRSAEDPLYLTQLLDDIYAQGRSLIETTRLLTTQDLASMSRLDLASVFRHFLDAFRSMTVYLAAPLAAASVLEGALEKVVEEHIGAGADVYEDYMLALTAPTKLTRFGHFHQQTLELANDISKDGNARRAVLLSSVMERERALKEASEPLYSQLRMLAARFGWLNLEYCFGETFNFEDVLERVSWLVRSDPEAKLRELVEQRRARQNGFNRILTELDPSPALMRDAQLEQEYGYVRHWRYEDLSLAGISARPLFEEVGRRLGLVYNELASLTPDEVLDLLESGGSADEDLRDLIAERSVGYTAVMVQGEITIASGSDVRKYREPRQVTRGVRELSGVSASPGFATGLVRVIRSKSQFGKMQPGDILVVTMTTPDYLVVMDKAAAIVADAGGRTSHTAIVSRELGIPCVIGTNFGTEVLEDGEVVEVDATKGKVMRVAIK